MTLKKKRTDQPPTTADTPTAETVEPPLWLSRLELPFEPAAVQQARTHTSSTLRDWAVKPNVIDNAELIVSELATNAVRHSKRPETGGRFVLTLCHLPKTLHIYVADDDPRPPVMRQPTDDGTGGRGLLLVNELSDCWGYSFPRPDEGTGKAVFAELRLVEPSPGDKEAAWDASPMPPIPDANPFTRARILSALREVIRGGPFVYA